MSKQVLSIAMHGSSSVIQYADNSFGGVRTDILYFDGENGGTPTFYVSPIVPTPTAAGQAAPKGYVDTVVAGVSGAQKVTVTITAASLASFTTTSNTDIAIGAALPANARFLGASLGEGAFTGFADPGSHTWNIEIGGATAGDICGNVNITSGQTGFPKIGTAGALGFPMAPQGGQQLHAHISMTGAALSLATAGNVTVSVWYLVVA